MRSTGTDQLVRAMKAGNAAGAKGLGQAVVVNVQLATGGDLGGNEAVRHPEAVGGEGLSGGESERWRCGRGWGVPGGIREDLKNNLYKVWNRMASGSTFPRPSKRSSYRRRGGDRALGIPTVADRVAQTVVTMALEPNVEPHFHPDSYAYRPGRSALDAVGTARERCWKTDWVIDLDIKALFDLACWYPPQQADRGSKVRRSNLPALSFRNALSVRGTSGNRYSPVWASSVMAIVPLWMRS